MPRLPLLTRYSPDERAGIGLVMLEDLLWGLFPVLTKLFVVGRDPILAAAVSSLAASIPFLIVLGVKGQLGELVRPEVRGRLALIALFGTVLSSICFFVGASMTSALNATLLGQLEPLYSLLLAGLLLREHISGRQLGATLLLVAGAVAVVFDGSFKLQTGDLLVALTPLWYQLAHTVAKRLFPVLRTPLAIPAARLALGGTVLLVIALARAPELTAQLFDPAHTLPLVAFGLVFIGLEKFLWYEAIRRIDLAKATALLVPSVAVGVLGALLVLGETPKPGQAVGLGLILAGLVWLTSGRLSSQAPPVTGAE